MPHVHQRTAREGSTVGAAGLTASVRTLATVIRRKKAYGGTAAPKKREKKSRATFMINFRQRNIETLKRRGTLARPRVRLGKTASFQGLAVTQYEQSSGGSPC